MVHVLCWGYHGPPQIFNLLLNGVHLNENNGKGAYFHFGRRIDG